MVTLESLYEHCPEAHVHILCLSRECYRALSTIQYPFASLYRLPALEKADPELAATRCNRTLVEYYFTLTSCWLWHLLQKIGVNEVTYLDADMMFFSSPEPLFVEAGEASVIITPHRFSLHLLAFLKFGLYNVSWITFRNSLDGIACLNWYRNACLEWCYDRVEKDRFADQKYLDVFCEKFSGVHMMRHFGGGVAPWNLEGLSIQRNKKGLFINGDPLIFYHAHELKHLWGPFYSSGLYGYGTGIYTKEILYIFIKYLMRYKKALQKARILIPESRFLSIRYATPDSMKTLRILKRIVREYRAKTLLVF